MAYSNVPIYPQSIINAVYQLTNGTGTTTETLVTAGTNGTKIENIMVTSTDTSARDLILNINISSTNYVLTIVSIPITAGTVDTVPSIPIFYSAQIPGLARDSNGNPYLYLASGSLLTISAGTTITSGKVINVIVQGGNY